eukprot:CAMPEP_0115010616 /NCGR_PEP_ID=MMETSP0216-20121206/23429_1 /TAXON_ID=223996 /ORGANISM="Protocruzia adherens, Strain Boccale" /LENGTH=65 /DNA_ID=CAMNT_0002378879 /DNA_START=79 /DNA_END=273 /DNA_ORIENTATION=-
MDAEFTRNARLIEAKEQALKEVDELFSGSSWTVEKEADGFISRLRDDPWNDVVIRGSEGIVETSW